MPDARVTVIRPASRWPELGLRDVWKYRDLAYLMVRRDFVAQYAQTILGPAWYLLQPVLTTIMFTVVFGRVARLPTDGLPPTLFYMAGVVIWSYFSTCVTRTSATFTANAHIFGKVWFPRLIVPISIAISALFALVIQLALFGGMAIWQAAEGATVSSGSQLLLLPLLIIQTGLLGLGVGIFISALTTKYRDLANLVTFGIQLWMYATPVVYPASRIPEKWLWIMLANPMAPIVEAFRVVSVGVGTVSAQQVLVSLGQTVLLLLGGTLLFSRIEKSFVDTV